MAPFGRLRALRYGQAVHRKVPHGAACRAVAIILFFESLIAGLAIAESEAPIALVPENLSWRSPPDNPALTAWVLGSGEDFGPYILRVHLAAGGRIRPHIHPDGRNSTVLQGVLYVGFGRTFDESKLVAIPRGAVCVIPANVPHYVAAKDRDVIYQEAGVGVTGTMFLSEASPR